MSTDYASNKIKDIVTGGVGGAVGERLMQLPLAADFKRQESAQPKNTSNKNRVSAPNNF
jgi:hypothetical protein